ncbi:MAG TPA: molecular chaperone TorD family protein [Phycisphaerae bacterium]
MWDSEHCSTPTPHTPLSTHQLARAKLARFVAELFSEPDESWGARLADDAVRDELRIAARILELPSERLDAICDSAGALDECRAARARLLGHTVRSECPPHELEYDRSEIFQQAQSLADIAAFYRAFGFEMGGRLAERGDHFVAEWEFLSVLAFKELLALQASNFENAVCCREAQRAFLKEHAARWMPAFFNRLRRAETRGLLPQAARLTEALLREWCGALSVPFGPEWLDLRPISDGDVNISCSPAQAGGVVELGPTLAAALELRGRD